MIVNTVGNVLTL